MGGMIYSAVPGTGSVWFVTERIYTCDKTLSVLRGKFRRKLTEARLTKAKRTDSRLTKVNHTEARLTESRVKTEAKYAEANTQLT